MGECRLSGACAEEPRPKSLTTRSSPDQRPVVGDFDHGYSGRVPPRGTWHLRWHMRLTCSDALSGGPCTADPGEKTSMHAIDGVLCPLIACQASHPETREFPSRSCRRSVLR